MNKKSFLPNSIRNLSLALLVCIGIATEANAGIFIDLSSPDTEYTPGQDNTFTFNVSVSTTSFTYIDRFQFVFPSGFTVQSGTPPSGGAFCGSQAGIQQICSPMISWTTSGVPCSGAFAPSGCGAYYVSQMFTVTVSVPGNYSGPLVVTLNTESDGFGDSPYSDQDDVTFAEAQPPQPGEPCALNCPGDIVINLDPGAP